MTDNVTSIQEDFSGLASNREDVVSTDCEAIDGQVQTDGKDDGAMLLREVDLDGLANGKPSLGAPITHGGLDQWGRRCGGMLRMEIIDQDSNIHALDMLAGTGSTLTGNETGNQITSAGCKEINANGTADVDAAGVGDEISDFESVGSWQTHLVEGT